jgi:O-antigen ligase
MFGLALTYLLAYGGALASLVFPIVGLLVYVCFGILKPDYFWYDSVPAGNFSRVVAIGAITGWALQGFGRFRLGKALPIAAVITSFWLWSILSASLAGHPENFPFIIDIGKILLTFIVGVTLIDSVKKLKLLAWVIVLSQACVAGAMEFDYVHGFNRAKEVGYIGDNNTLAIGMVTCFGLALLLAFAERRWRLKVLSIAAAFLIAHVVVISDSRGGMLALLITLITSFLLVPWRPGTFVILSGTMLVLLALIASAERQRFMTIFASAEQRDQSAESRLKLWGDNIDVTMRNPIFGCGPYGWPLVAADYGWPPGKQGHSLWLQTAAELGVPGLVLLVGFYVLLVRQLWPLTRRQNSVADPWLTNTARGIIAAIVAFAVSAQFVTVSSLEMPYYIAMLGAGLLKIVGLQREAPPFDLPPSFSTAQRRQLVNA